MRYGTSWVVGMIGMAIAGATIGCSKDEAKPGAAASAASAASAPPPASAPAPSATASAAPAVPVECPKGSAGDGTFGKPCVGKGAARMMEVTWTGKMDDKGPSFRVTNKSTQVILYGKIAVYFYDKAGKALPAKDKPFHTCGGNMFQGVMKASEKAVITFSCVGKQDVPDGATAIEAEMQMVGFTEDEKKLTSYWQNPDLTPDARKKGGVK